MSAEIAGSVIAITFAFVSVSFGIWIIAETVIEVIEKIRERRHK